MNAATLSALDERLDRTHLPALDGVRAVAVFVVIFSHSPLGSFPGDLGVSAFFVLSGFLITWLLLREREDTGTISLRRFYLRRTLRIFPAYYAFLAFSFLADWWLGTAWSAGLATAALLYGMNYYNAFLGHPSTSLAHCWSLAVEEQFYLVWPWLFRRIAPNGLAALARLLCGLTIAVAAWRSLLRFGFDVGQAYLYNAFDTRFDTLAVGCLLAVGLRSPNVRRLAERTAARSWLPIVPLVALGASRMASPDWRFGPGLTIEALLLAMLLVQLVQLAETPLWRWLEHPAVRYLGRISYPMYLWHAWGLSLGKRASFVAPGLRFALGVAITVGLASLSWALIERPFLRLKVRYETPHPGGGA